VFVLAPSPVWMAAGRASESWCGAGAELPVRRKQGVGIGAVEAQAGTVVHQPNRAAMRAGSR